MHYQLRQLFLPLAMAALGALPVSSAISATPAATDATTAPPARVIVKFKANSSLLQARAASATVRHSAQAQSLGRRLGLSLRSGAGVADRTQVVFADGIGSAQLASRLAREADVEYAVVDHLRRRAVTPNDPRYPSGLGGNGPAVGQWYLRAPSGAVISSINIEPAWAIASGQSPVVVAVLDTGIRYDHADLMPVGSGGVLLPGYDMVSDLTVANDGNGRDSDASDPGDWLTIQEATNCGDGNVAENSSWHGTQTAGVLGALTNNGVGMASVGRGNVQVLPVRVLGKCGGYDSDILAGMQWASGMAVGGLPTNPNPAKVINLSLGEGDGAPCNTAYRQVIASLNQQNIVVVASAGNEAGRALSMPANCPGVIAVAGLRHVGNKVGFSNVGPEVTLSAPAGNCVNTLSNQPCLYPLLTTTNAGTTTPVASSSIYSDSYNTSVGTSFSAPMVAGTAALMLSVDPTLSPTQIRAILMGSARPFPTTGGDVGDGRCLAPSNTDQDQCYCTTATCGAGMLDAGAALQALTEGLQAQIDFSRTAPAPGQALTISGAGSWAATGRSLTYQWTLVDGGGIVSAIAGSATANSISVTPSNTGRFTVSLTVTDNLNNTSTASQTIDVPVPVPVVSSGGGGG
ncbi:MAG: PKD domain-containing protein, partial [Rubrivivax sp.]